MKTISTRLITGLLIVAVGVAFLLSNLNLFSFKDLVSDWWPLVIVVAGIIVFLNDTKNYLWSLLIVVFGVVVQLNHLDILAVNPWQLFWPVVIIVIGLAVLLNRTSPSSKVSKSEREDVTAILSGSEVRIRSEDFKGSRVTALLGGATVDLRDATIAKEATLDLFSFWGGIEVRVPKGVIIKNETSVILGGVEDSTRLEKPAKGAPVLHIIGDIIMAGVEIKD